jgi:two-component SAPR family response regulator
MSVKPLIVSIDDELNILKLVKLVLEPLYTVLTFSDTRAALKTLQVSRPDLILCDINMPSVDGFELHTMLRDHDTLRSVPFIYLTALSDRDNFRRGMMQGADDYLYKPFSPDELREAVMTRLKRAETIRTQPLPEPWTISSLGGVALFADGRARNFNEAKKSLELFLYLVSKVQPVGQQEVMRNLWWDAVAPNTLHRLLSRARKTFSGLAEFDVVNNLVGLSVLKPYVWDAAIFEQVARQALLERDEVSTEKAILEYKGEFLADFDSPWSEEQRGHYEALYLQLLETSTELASSEAQRSYAKQRLQDYLGLGQAES